ncbi:MAG: hypothetical protein BGO12_16385 [Verrucomicrobia bacterium 61-8]|nr:hypothetical protein [Verrucomicrobiota bacterium]OJV16133.1 MAG: hypothetical protein BGO12_16385 [Verrucomicrobia bacterium 61-8]
MRFQLRGDRGALMLLMLSMKKRMRLFANVPGFPGKNHRTARITILLLAGLAIPAFADPPYEPYSPQSPQILEFEKGRPTTIKAIQVGTDTLTGQRALYIDYLPSSPSKNMWKQITEMYDVAQHFHPLASTEKVNRIWVRPMLNSDEIFSSKNTAYPYIVKDGVASSDWKIEFQPWFRSDKTKD